MRVDFPRKCSVLEKCPIISQSGGGMILIGLILSGDYGKNIQSKTEESDKIES